MNKHLEENVELCRRITAQGGIAIRALSLPHPELVKETGKAIGASVNPAPFFGPRLLFSREFIWAMQAGKEGVQK
ncbi:hypothetical protein [Pseudomonas putida]|uniref:hypothetical protein n=1 Tax=Pseudomonas putida TaxID=303 RepID=UPI0023636CFC|nr:hypothetical protein [Pseudomonas putida]MDD1988189.1 hypothetical protein [Pseudomonas putida]HDS1792971.1 hypothetical protein [Pseudomonas putida]